MKQKINILDVEIDNLSQEELLDLLEQYLKSKHSNLIITANTEILMRAERNYRFKEILNQAKLVIADGAGLLLAAKILGKQFKARIAGVDLVKEVIKLGYQKDKQFYFLGAKDRVIKKLKRRLKQELPGLKLKVHHGYLTKEDEAFVVKEINQSNSDILLVGLGSPLQEYFLARYLAKLDISFAIGVGGSFDILAQEKKRAPLLMQKLYLEWLYRLIQEPKRITRVMVIPEFILKIILIRIKDLM